MAHLSSLRPGYRALVFGASGGIGRAVTEALQGDPACAAVYAAARRPQAIHGKALPVTFDLADEASIASAVDFATMEGPLDLVFVATGLLHDESLKPEKSLKALDPSALERSFQANTIGPALIAKHALPKLRRDAKAAFAVLSARVGSIADNRLGGWHSYRASKAALNMVMRTCSIELARTHPQAVCVSLHPGTVDTGLSAPFQGKVPDGKLFTPQHSAESLLNVIDSLGPADTGQLFAWDGQAIPF